MDGPTMLQIIVQSINPTTRVGVSQYKLAIQNSKISDHAGNMKDMLDDMETNYQHIIRQKHTHDDYVMHLFTAMLTSKNEEFNQMIQRSKDEWELGTDVTSDALIKTAVVKYNNLVKQKVWNSGESKDAKIVALATKVEQLETDLATSSSTQSKPSSKNNGVGSDNIPDWKKKNTGPSIEMDGRTWY